MTENASPKTRIAGEFTADEMELLYAAAEGNDELFWLMNRLAFEVA